MSDDRVEFFKIPADSSAGRELLRPLEDALKARADEIRRAGRYGDVVAFALDLVSPSDEAAKVIGWDGKKVVWRVPRNKLSAIGSCDRATADWVKRSPSGAVRVFVMYQQATFLMNLYRDKAAIASGSSDEELAASRN